MGRDPQVMPKLNKLFYFGGHGALVLQDAMRRAGEGENTRKGVASWRFKNHRRFSGHRPRSMLGIGAYVDGSQADYRVGVSGAYVYTAARGERACPGITVRH
jgi:hypothetical protein